MLIHFFLLSHSTTLIDNIFTNNLEKYALILSDISDHLPIFVIAHNNELKTDEASYIVIRDKNTTNKTLFCNHLSAINGYDLAGIHEPKLAYSSFLNKFNDTYNSCFPLEKIKTKRSTVKKPWLSKGLLKSVKQKNRLYKRYLNSPSGDYLVKYIYVIYRLGGPYWENILLRSQKRPEAEGRGTFLRPRQNIFQDGPT